MTQQFNLGTLVSKSKQTLIGGAFAVIASTISAQAQSLAAFVTSDGWAVAADRGLTECGNISSSRYGIATDIIHDPSHRLHLIKFDTDGTAALQPELRTREQERVSVIFQTDANSGLTVRNRKILTTTGQNGDATYLRIAHERESRDQTQFVLTSDARLVGLVSGWEDNRATARVTKSGYIALLLAAHGHDFTLRRTAERIQESLVEVDCYAEDVGNPGFNEGTLSAFGAETWARAFTQLYQEAWSSPNATSLGFVDQVYGQSVDYFGKRFTRQAVMRDKSNFANRWDYRAYALREETLSIDCSSRKCTVEGVNDYFTFSSSRNQKSSGAASFSFDLDLTSLRITRENSSVLSRGNPESEGLLLDWAQATRNCNSGNDISCGRADYLEIVMNAFDYCVLTNQPRGRLREVGECG